jgi:hypothetical protein
VKQQFINILQLLLVLIYLVLMLLLLLINIIEVILKFNLMQKNLLLNGEMKNKAKKDKREKGGWNVMMTLKFLMKELVNME